MKTMIINGETFEVIHPRKYNPRAAVEAVKDCAGRGLSYYYGRYSDRKQRIFDEWREWYAGAEHVSDFGVCSANTCSFSISALLLDEYGNVVGVITITKAHNRIHMFD